MELFMTVKIEQFEPQLAQKLEAPVKTILHELQRPIHSHLQLRVSLRKANGGKQRSNSSADNWSRALAASDAGNRVLAYSSSATTNAHNGIRGSARRGCRDMAAIRLSLR